MRKNLVNEQQPFGDRHDYGMHPSTMATPNDRHRNTPGAGHVNGNNGQTIVHSFADKNPGAHAYACRNGSNPFAFVGKTVSESKVNLTERQTNAI